MKSESANFFLMFHWRHQTKAITVVYIMKNANIATPRTTKFVLPLFTLLWRACITADVKGGKVHTLCVVSETSLNFAHTSRASSSGQWNTMDDQISLYSFAVI
jgi:hypothetical protein